jgi:nitrite reductase/ring-hydroxylating ferredoxin subunit
MARGERLIARSQDLVERGRGLRFHVERDGRSVPAFAVRSDGVVRAYVNACAHQGVELDWEEGAFFDDDGRWLVCATHGAVYDPADGRCVGGPCRGRGLAPLPVVERDGAILVVEGE